MEEKATNSKPWEGAFNAFEQAYKSILGNPKPALFFVAVYATINIVSMILQGKTTYSQDGYETYADIIMLVFIVPLTAYALALASGKSLSVSEFMDIRFKKLVSVIFASILVVLAVLGSLLLFIIPAIWTIAWFAFAALAVVDKDLMPLESLRESKRLAQNHKGKVWGLIGVSILVSIAASVVAIIPYIGVAALGFASVITTVASGRLYTWLKTQA